MLQPSIRALLSNVAMAALLFGSAGTFAWPEAWAFLAIFDGAARQSASGCGEPIPRCQPNG
jgi:hypothetical protein